MSGSTSLSTDPFSDAERTDVRRFCGYPAYGSGNSGFQSWRFFEAYGVLEYRLTNLAPAEFQVVRQYLANLYSLESAIVGAAANLDTDQAAVWKHNRDEVRQRTALFQDWRKRLVDFIGVPPGPQLGAGNSVIV